MVLSSYDEIVSLVLEDLDLVTLEFAAGGKDFVHRSFHILGMSGEMIADGPGLYFSDFAAFDRSTPFLWPACGLFRCMNNVHAAPLAQQQDDGPLEGSNEPGQRRKGRGKGNVRK